MDTGTLADLTPDSRNLRRHTPRNVGMIVDALGEVGAARSIVVDEHGVILAGNATIEAAAEAGIERVRFVDADGEEIIAVRRSGLTDEQKRRLAIFDNRAAELAEWDTEALAAELADGADFTGIFHDEELDTLLGELTKREPLTDPDDVPEVPETPMTQRGDIIALGRHRLMCGDATSREDVERLMGGQKADMVWTDPPYGVDNAGGSKDPRSSDYRSGGRIEGDAFSVSDLSSMLGAAFANADAVLRAGGVFYIAHPDAHAYEFIHATRTCGWATARPPVVQWVKDSPVFGRGDYHAKCEPVLYGWKLGAAHHAVADRTQTNVWEIPRPKDSDEHPTMKPVELVARAVRNSSDVGDAVYDAFGGSGTTMIAAEQEGRRAYLMEIDPHYCDVIVKRWERFTGQTAERPSLANLEYGNAAVHG